jgi:hypothetical protein
MKMQVRRISILQTSKILTVFYFLLGFLYTLAGVPMIIFGDSRFRIMGVFYTLMPVVMAVFGFVFFVISAAVYNVLAGWLGGIEFETINVDNDPPVPY